MGMVRSRRQCLFLPRMRIGAALHDAGENLIVTAVPGRTVYRGGQYGGWGGDSSCERPTLAAISKPNSITTAKTTIRHRFFTSYLLISLYKPKPAIRPVPAPTFRHVGGRGADRSVGFDDESGLQ